MITIDKEYIEVDVDHLSEEILTWAVATVLLLPIAVLTIEELRDRTKKVDANITDEQILLLNLKPELCFIENDGYKNRSPILINGYLCKVNFVSDWNQVGPLIDSHDIDHDTNRARAAHCICRAVMDAKYKINGFSNSRIDSYGANIIEASMRCLVKSYVPGKMLVPKVLVDNAKSLIKAPSKHRLG